MPRRGNFWNCYTVEMIDAFYALGHGFLSAAAQTLYTYLFFTLKSEPGFL